MAPEVAHWVDWRSPADPPEGVDRVYLGHETCARMLPDADRLRELAAAFSAAGVRVTLVTPPVTEPDLARVRALATALAESAVGAEVVCSDWGTLAAVAGDGAAEPVAGRLLARQHTDPRIARMFEPYAGEPRTATHLDGTVCDVRHRPPGADLASALRGCWIDRPDVIALLRGLGVRRCELDNTAQGVEVSRTEGWHWSLNLPYQLVTMMRRCPGPGEDLGADPDCVACAGGSGRAEWRAPGLDVVRCDNGVYAESPAPPADLGRMGMDRVVLAGGGLQWSGPCRSLT